MAAEVVPVLTQKDRGRASGSSMTPDIVSMVGIRWVLRDRYCGQLGKVDNCQVAVSLSLATAAGSVPLAYQLYLPSEWAEDKARAPTRRRTAQIGHATKGEIAWAQIAAALAADIPRGTILMDAGYEDTALRDRLTATGLQYAVGIRGPALLWWGAHQPGPTPPKPHMGRPAGKRVVRDKTHQPISAMISHERCRRVAIAP